MTDLKHEIEEILHPEKKKLHKPPMAPPKEFHIDLDTNIQHKLGSHTLQESMAGENSVESRKGEDSTNIFQKITDSKPAIDFNSIAQSSEFQRFIYYLFTGKTHRGSLERLKKDITNFKEDTDLVRSYKGVMNEFKAKVAKLRGDEK